MDIYLEGDKKKMTQKFFFIVFLILMITLFCVYVLKVHTLTIPKLGQSSPKIDQDTRNNVKPQIMKNIGFC